MIELFYGILVFAAGYAALHSHCEMIQKVMSVIFVGWLIYVNVQPYSTFAARVELNLYLDIAQISVVALLYLAWRECKQSRLCWWVMACFCVMLALHAAQLLGGINLYWYYLSCNLLFTAQLAAVVVYSRLSYDNWRRGKGASWRMTATDGNVSRDLKVVQMRRKTG